MKYLFWRWGWFRTYTPHAERHGTLHSSGILSAYKNYESTAVYLAGYGE